MAPRWSNRDVKTLLTGIDKFSTYEFISRDLLGGKYTPSECVLKRDELAAKPWTEKELDDVIRLSDLIRANPLAASLRFMRPSTVLQAKSKVLALAQGRKGNFLSFIATPKEQPQVNKVSPLEKVLLSGLHDEKERLQSLIVRGGLLALVGPQHCGKRALLRSVCEDLKIEVVSLCSTDKILKAKGSGNRNSLIIFDDETLRSVDLRGYLDQTVVACLSRPLDLPTNIINYFGKRKRVFVGPPSSKIKPTLLKEILLQNTIPVSRDLDFTLISAVTYGYTCRDLEIVCDMATNLAMSQTGVMQASHCQFIQAMKKVSS